MMLMEVQTEGGASEEPPDRKRRNYAAADWKFGVGQAVRLDDLSAIVLSRSRSAKGVEIYRIWISGQAYGRPMRDAAAHVLQ